MVDNESIKFVEIPEDEPDTTKHRNRGIKYLKLKELNKYLLSEPFAIGESSGFLFTDDAGFMDTKTAADALGKNGNIKCKIELVDDVTNKVIGLINETEYSAANLPQGNISNYSLNTDGIGKKTARVKITISSNLEDLQGVYVSEYGTMDKAELAKSAAKTLDLKNPDMITSYNLEQNYPNPFNPSTMIKYQLPMTSEVSLKVYDILGKEVATLVNRTQAAGRYEVRFDASQLSSGVYIYRIKSGEYTATHKMLLLK